MKKLKNILQGIAETDLDLEISGISTDSRQDQQGKLFIAYAGVNVDAARYINDAISKGAKAVIGEQDLKLDVPYFKVADGRMAWAQTVANWYDHPEQKLFKIGVTGTDGKTTTSTLVYEIMQKAGIKTGLVSTVSAKIEGQDYDTGFHVTTPDPDKLWQFLDQLVQTGHTHVVMEVTSHALDQMRFGDMQFDIGVLTNVTHEHLDYHQTFENYRQAKAKLFKGVKYAVLNQNDLSFEYFSMASDQAVVIPYTTTKLKNVSKSLAGDYNLANIAAAQAVAHVLNIPTEIIEEVVQNFSGVPGRLEEINLGQKFRAIVDFAHTPNALEKVLTELRSQLAKGKKLILVFGVAGLRDHTKRPLMGEIATRLADKVIVTAEDPRTESLDDIYADIAAAGSLREDDRQKAIELAIKMAEDGDIVVATGKGHEQSMCFGTTEYPWSDKEAILSALRTLNPHQNSS